MSLIWDLTFKYKMQRKRLINRKCNGDISFLRYSQNSSNSYYYLKMRKFVLLLKKRHTCCKEMKKLLEQGAQRKQNIFLRRSIALDLFINQDRHCYTENVRVNYVVGWRRQTVRKWRRKCTESILLCFVLTDLCVASISDSLRTTIIAQPRTRLAVNQMIEQN